MSQTILIVGAGQAGGQLATGLRSEGFEGRIVLVGAESHPPYQRPPLSKQFLEGAVGLERVYIKPAEFYEQAHIEWLPGRRAETIARANKTVTLNDGQLLSYDKLALATGSSVRTLALPGAELDHIFYLRTIDDMQALQAQLRAKARLLIVGGGYIGLEVASVAVKKGVQVTVLEMQSRLMARVVGERVSEFYAAVHRAAGVEVHTGMRVSAFEGEGEVERVRCEDGSEFPADAVLIGAGILPNVALAEAAGLEVDDGIVVDECARTADPDIVALGDCTRHPVPRFARSARLESVPNALAQARTAAATLCGKEKPYTDTPWFWSDQYDLKLQIVGFADGCDDVVLRGDPADRQFMVCYLQEGELIAVESVNNPREFMLCRQLVDKRLSVTATQMADSATALKDVVAAGRGIS